MGTKKFEGLPLSEYEDVRASLRTGDIFLTAGNYPISRMIEHFSGSMFSHVGFIFTWESRVLLLESVEDDGVRAVPLRQYVNDYECSAGGYDGRLFVGRHSARLSKTKLDALLGSAADVLNRKYDQAEIAAILARVTLGEGRHTDNNAYICSEFVDLCFSSIGIGFAHDAQSGFIFPEHIAADRAVRPLYEIRAEAPAPPSPPPPAFAPPQVG
jgi:hypothetical protein